MNELIYKCAFNRIFNYNPQLAHELLKKYKTAYNIFNLSPVILYKDLKNNPALLNRINMQAVKSEANEVEKLLKEGYKIIEINSVDYPKALAECPDAPIVLYIKTTTPLHELFSNNNYISIVGTRKMTTYGSYWTKKIIQAIYQQYSFFNLPLPTIVSGLAYGIDTEAHKTALKLGMPTIAVMATGIDKVYPYRHMHIANQIANTPGSALITDYPMGEQAKKCNFLKRNRIIAGMSRATILVESKIKGGAMMTSRTAFSYSKEVYALPGRIDDECSSGCNELIAREIAQPIIDMNFFIKNLTSECELKLEPTPENIFPNEPKMRNKIDLILKDQNSPKELDEIKKIGDIIDKKNGITLIELSYESHIEYRYTAAYAQILVSLGLITIDIQQRCCINPLFKF